jgi:hypothetical protein
VTAMGQSNIKTPEELLSIIEAQSGEVKNIVSLLREKWI